MTRTEFDAWNAPEVQSSAGSEIEVNDLDDPIPEGLPQPALWRMFLMPVGIKRQTPGGIIIPDEAVDAEYWLNAIGRVCAIGPACFKHERYRELGIGEVDLPAVGDLIMYSTKGPTRFQFKGTRILVINDDQWFAKIPDESIVSRISCGRL